MSPLQSARLRAAAAALPPASAERGGAARVLGAAIAVGVLDGLAAAVLLPVAFGGRVMPVRTFQGIARALIGPAAFEGGLATAALGAAMHFGVALAWTLLFAAAYARMPGLRRATRTAGGVAAVGAAYGTLVWLVMRLVVLPLVGARTNPVPSLSFLAMLLVHMTLVGLPIAWLVRDRRPGEP